jgi:hypothetical protein
MMLLLLVVPLLFVVPGWSFSIQKVNAEANVVVTPTCGPASALISNLMQQDFHPTDLSTGNYSILMAQKR